MKINFKSFLIVFLVGLLGGACGTYGALSLYYLHNGKNEPAKTDTVINQVTYTNAVTGDYVSAIERSINSVVEITTQAEVTSYYFFGGTTTSDETLLGSGVIISEDGYIITNQHVIKDAKDVRIQLQDGESYEATIVGQDAKTNLALLKIDAKGLSYATLVDSDDLKLGQEVLAIDNSLGKGTSCSNGIISAINREVTINNYTMTLLLTNAEVNSGNSGGGLFDMNGNLIGVVNAKGITSGYTGTNVEGISYAIPSSTVRKIVEQLLNNGYVKDRPALGVKVYTQEYNLRYNIEGLVVSEVIEGGAADKAGIKAGDIIKSIDGIELSEFSQLAKLLDDYQIGDKVKLEIERDGDMLSLTCVLQETVN
ncbi:MAG: trypsin-like peptidase domain-containing protein [Erysipelotrichaceae bacterium]|nr:trypsin-like peptidase domain-containing protein [Erysipelotrichaceae bacterium]